MPAHPRATVLFWAAVLLTPVCFAAGFYLRMNAAYGPLNLSLRPEDWLVLWELFQTGQISTRVLLESLAAGTAGALIPWGAYLLLR